MRKQKKPATTTTTTTTPPVVVKAIVLPEHASAQLVPFEGLELEVSDEENPRVDAYEIAVRAEYKHPQKVGVLVERNRASLEHHGTIAMRNVVQHISKSGGNADGSFEERTVKRYFLNEPHAIDLVLSMRTGKVFVFRVTVV